MLLTLVELSPRLLLLYDGKTSDASFWNLFHCVLVRMNDVPVPTPADDFPAFIEHLYLIRGRLAFSDVKDLALLAEVLPHNRESAFWLWGFPSKIGDPRLFLEALLYLQDRRFPP